MPALMLQGTGSDVGKSVLVAALCRALVNRGLAVRPFKPQNMSTNAGVAADGGEIARAQMIQALASRVEPTVDMNPVLLKPQSDRSSQLVVRGQVRGTLDAANFRSARAPLLDEVLASYRRLAAQCDIVLVEGAGSPAEVNLREGDIANMGFARAAGVPVVLIGDIDRGGVIASIVGTRAVLDPADAALIRGFIINKFRGDQILFEDGYRRIEELSGWRGFGILPWLPAAARIPAEDAVVLDRPGATSPDRVVVACPITPHISNFDDLDPLRLEPSIEVCMIPPGHPIPAEAALIILPGSKATIADLEAIRTQGWDIDIRSHRRRGRQVLGLCGGFQILGRRVSDPQGIEGPARAVDGLGLLDVETVLVPEKRLEHVAGTALQSRFEGYLMHMGRTDGPDHGRPFAQLADGTADGAISADGLIMGTYVHGLFGSVEQRTAWAARLGIQGSGIEYGAAIDHALDELASGLETHLDIDGLIATASSSSQ
jgi:adenosylcobyric acid synthase